MTETECVERLQAVVDQLRAEGAGYVPIVAALVEVIVQSAYEDRPWAPDLLKGVAVLIADATEAAQLRRDLDAARKALKARRGKRRAPRKKK